MNWIYGALRHISTTSGDVKLLKADINQSLFFKVNGNKAKSIIARSGPYGGGRSARDQDISISVFRSLILIVVLIVNLRFIKIVVSKNLLLSIRDFSACTQKLKTARCSKMSIYINVFDSFVKRWLSIFGDKTARNPAI